MLGFKLSLPTIILTFVLFTGGMQLESADVAYGQVSDKELKTCVSILDKLGEKDTTSLDIDSGIAIFQNGTKMTCNDLKDFWIKELEFRQFVKDYDAEAAANELTGANQLTNESTINPNGVAQPIQINSQGDATLHINVKGASPDTGHMLIGVFGNTADNLTQPIISKPTLVDIGKMAQKHQTDRLEIGTFNFTADPVLGGHMYSCLFVPDSNFTEARCNNVGLDTKRDSYDVIVDISGFKE